MTALDLLAEVKAAGGALRLEGDALKVSAACPLPDDLMDRLRAAKADLVDVFRLQKAPRLDPAGGLRIPFGSDPKAQWWKGGRSIVLTLLDLRASYDEVKAYLDPDRGDWLEEQVGKWISDGATEDEAEQAALRLLAEKEG